MYIHHVCMAANVGDLKLPPVPKYEAEALDLNREDYELWREAGHKEASQFDLYIRLLKLIKLDTL